MRLRLTFTKTAEKNGIVDFMKVINNMPSFDTIEFQAEDICRSGLVKEYIIAKLELGSLMFIHEDVPFVPVERETIDGVRYYKAMELRRLCQTPIHHFGDQLQKS